MCPTRKSLEDLGVQEGAVKNRAAYVAHLPDVENETRDSCIDRDHSVCSIGLSGCDFNQPSGYQMGGKEFGHKGRCRRCQPLAVNKSNHCLRQ